MNIAAHANQNGQKIIASGHAAFQEGVTYATRSICDHDCIFSFTIVSRTAKRVTIKDKRGEVSKRGVSTWAGVEQFKPFGSYSMAAIIGADRILAEG
jgi:hypothetical protein